MESDKILNKQLAYHQGRVSVGEEKMFDILMIASTYCIREKPGNCINWLERAFEAGEMDYKWYLLDPIYSSVKGDSRFNDLMDKMRKKVQTLREEVIAAETSNSTPNLEILE